MKTNEAASVNPRPFDSVIAEPSQVQARSTSRPLGSDVDALVEHLTEEMSRRWRSGERPVVEEYLALYPQLLQQPAAAAELIYEEICLRHDHGLPVANAEILARF